MGEPEQWVDYARVAEHFGVSRATVLRYVEQGMPSAKLGEGSGAARRFRLSKCDEWAEENGIKERAA